MTRLRPHIPVVPPKNLALAMIVIRLRYADRDGAELETETWAIGPTSERAFYLWKRRAKALAPFAISHTVATEGLHRVTYNDDKPRFGARLPVYDELLAKAAVGIKPWPNRKSA